MRYVVVRTTNKHVQKSSFSNTPRYQASTLRTLRELHVIGDSVRSVNSCTHTHTHTHTQSCAQHSQSPPCHVRICCDVVALILVEKLEISIHSHNNKRVPRIPKSNHVTLCCPGANESDNRRRLRCPHQRGHCSQAAACADRAIAGHCSSRNGRWPPKFPPRPKRRRPKRPKLAAPRPKRHRKRRRRWPKLGAPDFKYL